MVEIKITDVIRCSSEDSMHPSANLMKNNGYWVCSKDNKESSIEVELQFEKEAVISFIDIANHGSQMVDILVSHSTRCRGGFVCLVPTFNFMSVVESKQRINTQGVQMFKADDMLSDSKFLSWDRLKLVCRQPYANGKQFGLSFISLKTVPQVEKDASKKLEDKNQNKLNDFFDKLQCESSPLRKPKIAMWSSPLSPKVGQLKSPKLKENRTPISPTDQFNTSGEKTPKRILSAAAITQFREEVSCFLEDVNFNDLMKTRSIKVSDLRNQIEKQRGLALVRQQKILFMEIITERLKVMKQSKEITGNLVASPANQPMEAKNIDYDIECKKCHTKLPKSVIGIHSKLCMPSTPTRSPTPSHTPRNRNQLCFDIGDDISDLENPRKRTKLNTSESSSSGVDNSKKLNGLNGSNGNSPTNSTISVNVVNKVPVVNGFAPPSFSSKDSVKNKLCSILTKNYPDSSVSDNAMIVDSLDNDSNMVGRKLCPSFEVDTQLGHVDLTTKNDKACDVKKGPTSVDLSEFDDNRDDIMGESDSEFGECPICFLQIPMFKLAIHASNCEGKIEKDEGHDAANDADLPALSLDDVVDVVQQLESTEEVSTKTTDLVQCPICQKMFSAERIDVHANVCLDFSSSNLDMSE